MQKDSPTVAAARMEHSTQVFVVQYRQKASGAMVPELQPSYSFSIHAYLSNTFLSSGDGPWTVAVWQLECDHPTLWNRKA